MASIPGKNFFPNELVNSGYRYYNIYERQFVTKQDVKHFCDNHFDDKL